MQDILIKKSAAVALVVLKNNKVVRSGLRKLGKLETFMRFLEEEEGADGGEDGAKARLDKERSKRDDPDQDLHNFYSKLENVKMFLSQGNIMACVDLFIPVSGVEVRSVHPEVSEHPDSDSG
ncbi:hypothetical protein Tco_0112765 [Tanacetum coccineum]